MQRSEAGDFDEDAAAADLLQLYEARIAALERLVGKQALELESLKGGSEKRAPAEKRDYVRHCRAHGPRRRRRMPADGNFPLLLLRPTDCRG